MTAPGIEKISEFRIVLPLDMEECRKGHLWSTAEASKNETGGHEGVETIVDEPFAEDRGIKVAGQSLTSGRYTHKTYHLCQKIPSAYRNLAPRGSVEILEKSWNSFPLARTVYTNPDYLKDSFHIIVDTVYVQDRGTTDNIHKLSDSDLAKRDVVNIDIVNHPVSQSDYKPEYDPCKVRSEKAGRGPLPSDGNGSWRESVDPVICCYKLYRVKFDWFGLKDITETRILRTQPRILSNYYRQLVCWMDRYLDMTMEEVREFVDKTWEELRSLRAQPGVRGTFER